MKARKSVKAKSKRIEVTKGKPPKIKRVAKRAHTRTAFETCLQHNADLRWALMKIRDLEPVSSPGMSAVQGPSLRVAQDIAREALEP